MALRRKQRNSVLIGIFCGLIFFISFSLVSVAAQRVLEQGMQGNDVRYVQERLKYLGFEIEINGVFGESTRVAIEIFQSTWGLKADGIVGPSTISALEQADRFPVYVVKKGDTLSSISRQFKVGVGAIRKANGIKGSTIKVGQKLVIPVKHTVKSEEEATVRYTVKKGDTLTSIAKKFGTTVNALKRLNNISDPNKLKVGDRLIVSEGSSSRYGGNIRFMWPVRGSISSGYGKRTHPVTGRSDFHEGIDIAVPTGTPVVAAAAGRVKTATRNSANGNYIVIDHGDNVLTYYLHNSKLLVKKNDYVRKGQVIAESGSTGISTGPHLDFRIKVRGKWVNPLEWLP